MSKQSADISTSKTIWPGVRRVLSVALAVSTLVCLAIVGIVVVNGGPCKVVVTASYPLRKLAIAVLCVSLLYAINIGYRNTVRQWMVLLGRMTLLCVSLMLCLLVAEIALRAALVKQQASNSLQTLKDFDGKRPLVKGSHPMIHIITPSANTNLIYELKAGFDTLFGHRRLHTNSDSMRDSKEYDTARTTNSVRIVAVGDSGLFGWDLHQDEDFLSVLESNLNARSDGTLYEALNFGVPGYNTWQEVELLASKGVKYKPDIVIISWSANDFQLPFCVLQKENFRRRDMFFLRLFVFNRDALRDACAMGVANQREGEFDPARVPATVAERSGVNGVRHALARAQQLAGEHGFHLLVCGTMQPDVVSICEELRIDVFNIETEIPKGSYPEAYAIHFMHPRKEGHAVLAEHLESALRERGWLDPVNSPQQRGVN